MREILYKAVFRYQIPIAILFLVPASSYYLGIALPESFMRSKASAVLFPRAACDLEFLANFPSIPVALYQSSLLLTIMTSIAFTIGATLLAFLAPRAAVSFGLKPGPHTNLRGRIVPLLLLMVAGYLCLTTLGASSPDKNCSWFKSVPSFEPSAIYDKLFLAGLLSAGTYSFAYIAILLFLYSRIATPSPTSQ